MSPTAGASARAVPSAPATLAALFWDVDGTLAETERDGHLVAFNRAFEAEGVPWRWNDARYGKLLEVAGGRERLLHDMQDQPDAPSSPAERERLATRLHQRKNRLYAALVADGAIALRPGVRELIDECGERGVPMAITTTTTRASVAALLSHELGGDWEARFATLVCSEDVRRKKPDPEVFEVALRRLGVAAAEAVAIEDSPNGVIAARAAGCRVVVTRSLYFADAAIEGALAVGPGLEARDGWRPAPEFAHARPARIGLDDIQGWLRREPIRA